MNQKGFMLIELLVGMVVGGMIMAVTIGGIFQILQGAAQTSGKSVALADIDNAAHWITRDMVMVQSTNCVDGAPAVANITMTWDDVTNWALEEGTNSHCVTYTHSGTELQRNYDGVVTTAGRYLTDVGFSMNGRLLTVTLTSCLERTPRYAVTRRYLVQMRAE